MFPLLYEGTEILGRMEADECLVLAKKKKHVAYADVFLSERCMAQRLRCPGAAKGQRKSLHFF